MEFITSVHSLILGGIVGHLIAVWKMNHRKFSSFDWRLDELEAWKRLVEREVKKTRNPPPFDTAMYEQVKDQRKRERDANN